MNKPPMEIYHIYSPMQISFNRERDGGSGISSHISDYPPHLAEQELLSDISNHAVVLGDAAPPLSPESVGGLRQSAVKTEATPPPMDAAGNVLADLAVKSVFEGAPPSLIPGHTGAPLSELSGLEGVVPPDISSLGGEASGWQRVELGEAAPPAEAQLSE
jgi:hypothetical protein